MFGLDLGSGVVIGWLAAQGLCANDSNRVERSIVANLFRLHFQCEADCFHSIRATDGLIGPLSPLTSISHIDLLS